MTIQIILADDHAMVRKGLQVFLSTQPDFQLVGEAANGQETLDKVNELSPDIVLMDLNMPLMNGIETTKQLKTAHPAVKVIVLTSFSDQDHVLPVIRAGAKGYLLKDIEPEELAAAIRRVYQGKVELHPEAAKQLMNNVSDADTSEAADPFAELTKREHDVLRLISSGKSNKDIGESLFVSEKTVKTHVSHVLSKLGLVDRTQAAIYAIKHGIDAQE